MCLCPICHVDFSAEDPLFKTKVFLCNCKETICYPCATVIILNNVTFSTDRNIDVMMHKNTQLLAKCPFCRKQILPFFQKLLEQETLYQMLLAIKMYQFLGKESDVNDLRKKYVEIFEVKCPL